MSMLDLTYDILRSNEFDFTPTKLGSTDAIVGTLATDCGFVRCFLFTAAEERFLMLLGYTSQKVPDGALSACRDLVCRTNGELALGTFCIDDDGEIVIRCATLTSKEMPADCVITLMSAAKNAADCYLPAFNSIIYGNEEAKAAFVHASSK